MAQHGKHKSLSTVETILAYEIQQKQEAGEPFDNTAAILERLRRAKLEYADADNKTTLTARAGLALGICASAVLLTASASPEHAIPVAPAVQVPGVGHANMH